MVSKRKSIVDIHNLSFCSCLVSGTDETVKRWQSTFQALTGKVDTLLATFHRLKIDCNEKLEEISSLKNEYKTENTGFYRFEELYVLIKKIRLTFLITK